MEMRHPLSMPGHLDLTLVGAFCFDYFSANYKTALSSAPSYATLQDSSRVSIRSVLKCTSQGMVPVCLTIYGLTSPDTAPSKVMPEPTADISRSRPNATTRKAKRSTSSRPASLTAEPPRKKIKLVDALPGTIEPQSGSCINSRYMNTRRCVACIVSRTDSETIGYFTNLSKVEESRRTMSF